MIAEMSKESNKTSLFGDSWIDVPKHPKYCPLCNENERIKSKVKIYHLNTQNDALFMCSNIKCPWPFTTHSPQEILGKSDFKIYVKHNYKKLEKKQRKKKKKNKDLSSTESKLPKFPHFEESQQIRHLLNNEELEKVDSTLPLSTPEKPIRGFSSDNPQSPTLAKIKEQHEPLQTPSKEKDEFNVLGHMDLNIFSMPNMLSPIQNSPAHSTTSTDNEADFLRPYNIRLPKLLSPMTPMSPQRKIGDITDDDESSSYSELGTPLANRFQNSGFTMDEDDGIQPKFRKLSKPSKIDTVIDNLKKSVTSYEETITNNHESKKQESRKMSSPKKINNTYSSSVKESRISIPTESMAIDITSSNDIIIPNMKKLTNLDQAPENFTKSTPSKITSPKIVHKIENSTPISSNEFPTSFAKSASIEVTSPENILKEKNIKTIPPGQISLNSNESTSNPSESLEISPKIRNSTLTKNLVPIKRLPSNVDVTKLKKVQLIKNTDGTLVFKDIKNTSSLPCSNKVVKRYVSNKCKALSTIQPVKLNTLSNRISMNLGQSISLKVIDPACKEDKVSQPSRVNIEELERFSGQLEILSEEENIEFKKVMKVIAPSSNSAQKSFNLDFITQVQKSLDIATKKSNEVVFNINTISGSNSIDLPMNTIDVDNRNGIKIMLNSDSDAADREALRVPSPIFESIPKKPRGRKPGSSGSNYLDRTSDGQLTLIPSPQKIIPDYITSEEQQYQQQRYTETPTLPVEVPVPPPPPHGLQEFLTNQELVRTFRYHLNIMMSDYHMPEEWIHQGIDPYIAMLLSRKEDPSYRNIDIDAMLQMYAKVVKFEIYMRQKSDYENYIEQLAIYEQRKDQRRTYATLQPVKGKMNGNASDVLRQHQGIENSPNRECLQSPQKSSEAAKEISSPSSFESGPLSIKYEIIDQDEGDGFSAINPESVMPTSVHPPPDRSVIPVPDHLKHTTQSSNKIGKGQRIMTWTFEKSSFGPIYVSTDEEAKNIIEIVQEKVKMVTARKEKTSIYNYTSASARARSNLPQDVLEYIDRAFTVKGLRESVIGRKKRNYPKRNQVIKVDKETGEFIYPPNHPKNNLNSDFSIKPDPESLVNKPSSPAISHQNINSNTSNQKILERNVFNDKIPEIINIVETEKDKSSRKSNFSTSPKNINQHIDNMLLKKSERDLIKSKNVNDPVNYHNEVENDILLPNKERNCLTQRIGDVFAPIKETNVKDKKDEDEILSSSIANNSTSKSTNSLFKNSVTNSFTPKEITINSKTNEGVKTRNQSLQKSFDQSLSPFLPSTSSIKDNVSVSSATDRLSATSIYVRPNQSEKVRKLLVHKQRKERLAEKKRSKLNLYKGFDGKNNDTSNENKSKSKIKMIYQDFGGKRKVMKKDGTIVEINGSSSLKTIKPKIMTDPLELTLQEQGQSLTENKEIPKPKNPSQLSEEEQNILAELFKVTEDTDFGKEFSPKPAFNSTPQSNHFEDELLATLNDETFMPSFDDLI